MDEYFVANFKGSSLIFSFTKLIVNQYYSVLSPSTVIFSLVFHSIQIVLDAEVTSLVNSILPDFSLDGSIHSASSSLGFWLCTVDARWFRDERKLTDFICMLFVTFRQTVTYFWYHWFHFVPGCHAVFVTVDIVFALCFTPCLGAGCSARLWGSGSPTLLGEAPLELSYPAHQASCPWDHRSMKLSLSCNCAE